MISDAELLNLLKETGGLLEGHFLLTSGKHSDIYIEKFRVLENPFALDRVCQAMADRLKDYDIDLVIGAAVGGILLAGGVGRHLGVRHIFSERVDGKMEFRRGFSISPGVASAIVEDVVTTGGSVSELIRLASATGASVKCVVNMADRSLEGVTFDIPTYSLLKLPSRSWTPVDCPLCKLSIPFTSRGRSGK